MNNSRGDAIEQYPLQNAEVDNSTENVIEQYLLQEAEVDNSREEKLTSLITTHSGRVSKLPNGYRIFSVEKSTSSLVMNKQSIMAMLAQEWPVSGVWEHCLTR